MNNWINKQNVVYPYNGILLNNKKKEVLIHETMLEKTNLIFNDWNGIGGIVETDWEGEQGTCWVMEIFHILILVMVTWVYMNSCTHRVFKTHRAVQFRIMRFYLC